MAYSGTQTFNLSIEEIIQEAHERCQLQVGEGYDLKTAKRSLNLMFAEWANRGLNLWTIEYATQTLTAGTSNLEGDSNTTDVNVNRISRTEYLNLSKKENKSTGDGRPVQFALIPGQVTVGGSSSTGRPENDMTLFLYPSPDKAYIFKYFYVGRIQDAGDYTNNADVPFYFLPCLTAGLSYYISLKKAPMLSANLKAVYDEEFERAADNDRERTSFRVEPAQAYIP